MNTLESYIVDRKVDQNMAKRLRQMEECDKQEIINVISVLSPSANTLRGLLRLVEEIGKRDSRKISEVMSVPSIRDLMGNEKLGRKDLQAKILSELEMMRYPERAKLQQQVEESVKVLVKTYGVSISVPDELEGDTLVVSVKAKSPEELDAKLSGIKDMGSHPACKEIYSILLGDT